MRKVDNHWEVTNLCERATWALKCSTCIQSLLRAGAADKGRREGPLLPLKVIFDGFAMSTLGPRRPRAADGMVHRRELAVRAIQQK